MESTVMITFMRAVAIPAVLLAAAGCASSPKPVADLANAHALVAQAEQSDAQQFASSDLEAARSKLRQADTDAQDKPVIAARLAQESAVDAEVALARTRSLKAAQALNEVNAGTQTLRGESQRSADHPATTPPPPPAPV